MPMLPAIGAAQVSFKPLRLGAVFLWTNRQLIDYVNSRFKPLRLGAVFLCYRHVAWDISHFFCFKPLRLGAVFL